MIIKIFPTPCSKFIDVLYYTNITLMTLFMNQLTFYGRKWLKSATMFCKNFKTTNNTLWFYIDLTQSKTILENTVEIEPQPVAIDFKNLSQYSSHSK